MSRKQQVLLRLKLKAKSLGFNVKELKGIAAKIADNLTSAEDATEEDVNAEIDTQIDAVLPYLTFGQSQANRLLDEWKKKHPETGEDDEEEDDEGTEPSPNPNNRPSGSKKTPKDKNDNAPEWAKGMMKTIEALNGEIATLKGEKVTTSRKEKLESMLKDTGTFGTRTLKSFSKMKFENDEEFEEFLTDVEGDLKAFNQERADSGLSTMGAPPSAGGGKPNKEETITDEQLEQLAGSF